MTLGEVVQALCATGKPVLVERMLHNLVAESHNSLIACRQVLATKGIGATQEGELEVGGEAASWQPGRVPDAVSPIPAKHELLDSAIQAVPTNEPEMPAYHEEPVAADVGPEGPFSSVRASAQSETPPAPGYPDATLSRPSTPPEQTGCAVVAEPSFPEEEIKRLRASLYGERLPCSEAALNQIQQQKSAQRAWVASEVGESLDQRGQVLAKLWGEQGLQEDLDEFRRDLFEPMPSRFSMARVVRRQNAEKILLEAKDPGAEVTYDVLRARLLLQDPEVAGRLASLEAEERRQGERATTAPSNDEPTHRLPAEPDEPRSPSRAVARDDVAPNELPKRSAMTGASQGSTTKDVPKQPLGAGSIGDGTNHGSARRLTGVAPMPERLLEAILRVERKPLTGHIAEYYSQSRGSTEVSGAVNRAGEVTVHRTPGAPQEARRSQSSYGR